MRILVIDNYDSFTFNLVQYLEELGANVEVCRNDELTVDEILVMNPDGILISPGPGTPDRAGETENVIRELGSTFPIFGVCLGMQAIGEVFGAKITRAGRIMHGKTSRIDHSQEGVFGGIPDGFEVVRYHSLALEKNSIPEQLEVTATSDDGEVMGIRHKSLDVEGVQFHPESALSEHGRLLLKNWLSRVESNRGRK